MAPTPCPAPGCTVTFNTDLDPQALTALIQLHARTAHPPAAAAEPTHPKAEKVHRPTITTQGTTEDWSYFLSRWQEYKAATKITGVDIVFQLLETCEDTLRRDLNRTYGTLVGETEDNVLRFIKTLAIRPENIMVARVKLINIRQERDEPVRSFCARLRGQASVCNFNKTKQCQCTENVSVDFSEDMVRDALIRGLADDDIQLHILGQANQDMTLEETLQLAEAQECGKRSAGRLLQHPDVQTTANATSSYRQRTNTQLNQPSYKQRNTNPTNQYNNSPRNKPPRSSTTTPPTCSHCGQPGHGNGKNVRNRMKSCPAYNHRCSKCNITHHYEHVCRISQRQNQQPNTAITQDAVFEDFDQAGFFQEIVHDRLDALSDS